MQVIVRALEGEPNVEVQVQWKGAYLNFSRARDEAVQRFLARLGIRCGTHAGLKGGDKKRAKKEKVKAQGNGTTTVAQTTAPGMSICLVGANGSEINGSTTVAEAFSQARHLDIEGERLPLFLNPPSIKKLEAYGKPLAGCPIAASMHVEFSSSSAFGLRWMLGAAVAGAGEDAKSTCIGTGQVLRVPSSAGGKVLTLDAELEAVDEGGARVQSSVKVGLVEEPMKGWPDERLVSFGRSAEARDERRVRIVSWNMLAPPYARTSAATRRMYPYCTPGILDFTYRQPLLGRELARLDGDVVMLQEVTFSTYRKYLMPVFGDQYYSRIMLKASSVSDGCVTLLRRDCFEVVEEADFLFRRLLCSDTSYRTVLSEVRAKWPDFFEGVLPNLSTVFQLTVARHRPTGELMVLANTHLFYHPLARHIRLLQIMCLLHQASKLREKYKGQGGTSITRCEFPRVLFCGDLNSSPDTAALELLLKGEVSSNHSDWECADQFKWGREEDELDDDCDCDADAYNEGTAIDDGCSDSDTPPIMPKEHWQEGRGVALSNPLGPLSNAYSSTPMHFTNFVADFNAVLDYILMSGPLKVIQTLRGVSEAELEDLGGLPCELYPSDHLAIAADAELVGPEEAECV